VRIRALTLRRHDFGAQLARFLVVGISNTAVSFVAYRLLLVVSTPYVIAAALGFAVGAVNGYVFNRRWTFAARDSTRARFLYVLVQVVGAASTSLLVWFFVRAVGIGKVEAYLAAIPPVTFCMFLANRIWTFTERTYVPELRAEHALRPPVRSRALKL
jgi:putative flippase GtrA